MSNVWCIRAEYGTYANHFVKGGFVGIGYEIEETLAGVSNKDELSSIYRKAHPTETSNLVVGQQVGQISRFLLEMKSGDYVITPSSLPASSQCAVGQ
jgi:predicted Mrr-cat superfamily restriction endonuclease